MWVFTILPAIPRTCVLCFCHTWSVCVSRDVSDHKSLKTWRRWLKGTSPWLCFMEEKYGARINEACTQNTLDGILPQGPVEQDLVCKQAAGLTLGIIQDSLSLVYTLKEMKIHCPHVSRMWLEAWNNKRSVCTLAGATHRVLPIVHTAMRNRPSKIRVILSCWWFARCHSRIFLKCNNRSVIPSIEEDWIGLLSI